MRLLSVLVLVVAACSGEDDEVHIGDECSQNDRCQAAGLACETSAAGGYCTSLCTRLGERAECPAEAVCDALGNVTNVCVRLCEDAADCRDDQECNGVTGTNLKACKPK
ncbi:MAG TPA: hypothetical protein VM513_18800 [Kofleriaceae bacterium]|jgi:hypothetical protein|nr:hypothetical protein [Kofleriaceae bacterium]